MKRLFSIAIFLVLVLAGCTNQTQKNGELSVKIVVKDLSNETLIDKVEYVSTNQTLFDLMLKHDIEYQNYSFGPFITSIAGVSSNNGTYWGLYLNGQYAEKGVNEIKLEENLTVLWKLEKLN